MSVPEASRCRRLPEGGRWWRIAYPRRPRIRRTAEAVRFLARHAIGPLPLPKRWRRLDALRWGFVVARDTALPPCRARGRGGGYPLRRMPPGAALPLAPALPKQFGYRVPLCCPVRTPSGASETASRDESRLVSGHRK